MIDLVPATRRTAELIANIGDDQLASPTPCPDYTLGDLLDHVDGLSQAFTDAATKQPRRGRHPAAVRQRRPSRGRLAHPHPAAAGHAGRSLARPWRVGGHDPGRRRRHAQRDRGSGRAGRGDRSWLGHRQGQRPALRRRTRSRCACIQTMAPQPGEERPVGDDVPFGRPVDVADDARPIDRLVAVLGRDPAWTPR